MDFIIALGEIAWTMIGVFIVFIINIIILAGLSGNQ